MINIFCSLGYCCGREILRAPSDSAKIALRKSIVYKTFFVLTNLFLRRHKYSNSLFHSPSLPLVFLFPKMKNSNREVHMESFSLLAGATTCPHLPHTPLPLPPHGVMHYSPQLWVNSPAATCGQTSVPPRSADCNFVRLKRSGGVNSFLEDCIT